MAASSASDLHMAEGSPPVYRINGQLMPLKAPPLDRDAMVSLLKSICARDRWDHFTKRGDLDFAYALGEAARFRVNYMKKHTGLGAVFRMIPPRIPTLEQLNLPPVLETFSELHNGLVLVTGPTGSGKSTTIAALIDRINSRDARHIITIEEPIEFVHIRRRSLISQREVGLDADTFGEALRNVTRQDPDVILVGEMRDLETIRLAVTAAEMGTLVFSTLHTNSAAQTVDRIIDVFPANQQKQIRGQLAQSLRGVCAQLLLRTKEGKGRVPANEIMIVNWAVSNAIREGETPKIPSIIEASRGEGMQLMDDALLELLKRNRITYDQAYSRATDRKRLVPFKAQR